MANGIIDTIKDKTFPTNAPNSRGGSGALKELLFSPPITKGGMNPFPLLNPNRPQVDFSSVKTDYRSEMMRRDLNGILDGDEIKAGQFIKMGVTVLSKTTEILSGNGFVLSICFR